MIIKTKHSSKSSAPPLLAVAVFLAVFLLLLAPAAFAYDNEELALLSLINNHRQSQSLSPLSLSPTLSAAAEGHSNDMASHNFFSHTGSNGSSPQDRMRAGGYTYNTSTGENIAAGYETASQVFSIWKASNTHNAIMLSPNYRAVGIGRAYNSSSNFQWYWTADFGGVDDTDAPPSVAITSPQNGQTVSGTVNVQANASDDRSVTKVDFYIDNDLVASDTTAPYSYSWNTTAATNGSHSLKAVAYDSGSHYAQHSITVTVSNSSPPPGGGLLQPLLDLLGLLLGGR